MSPQEESRKHFSGASAKGSPQLMRQMNRSKVLLTLRDGGPMTRPAMSKATGLSKITVDAVAAELLAEDRVVESPEPPTGSPGRRARLLTFRHDSAHVAALDIGASRARVAVADLSGALLAQEQVDLAGVTTGATVIALVRSALQRSIAVAGLSNDRIRALCIGTPGIVDPVTQRVRLAPQLPQWDDVDLVAEMSFIGDCPILVENEVHLAVVGERWRGAARGLDDIAYVHLGVGVGLGIVKSGQLLRGAHGGAGEIGYLPLVGLDADNGEGGRGRFEWLVGGAAYTRAAQALVESGRGESLLRSAGGDSSRIDAALIFAAAKAGDKDAEQIVDRILGYTASGIATVITVLDPGVLIIGGGLSQAGTWMLERLEMKMRDLALVSTDLCLAGLGDDAVIIGACSRAIDACEHELLELNP